MASFARHVDVEWNGNLLEGNGTATAGTGAFTHSVTFPSRINERGDGKTTPEELLAGAHAVCYAMVLANTIGKQGGKARRLRVTATVTGDRSDAGLKVVSSDLKVVVEGLEGIDPGGISDLAKNAEKGCPISNAIRGNVAISVDASAS
jgi:osmotically inducible protein OsmC